MKIDVGYPTASVASRGPKSRTGLNVPPVLYPRDIVTVVVRRPMMKACIPAPGGLFPESPKARMEHPMTADPRNSVKNAEVLEIQSLGCV